MNGDTKTQPIQSARIVSLNLKSIPKRKSEHKTVEVPINAHLGKYHTVRMADDAKLYFVKDNRAANSKEYKTKVMKHNNHDTTTRRKDKHWYVELNQEGFDPKTPPWKLARDRDIAAKRASWDFKATYPKRAPQCEKQNLSVFKKYGSLGEIAASSEEPEEESLKESHTVAAPEAHTKLMNRYPDPHFPSQGVGPFDARNYIETIS